MARGRYLMLTLIVAQSALAADSPPPGLLEYLGSMVESDGQLVDPLAMAAVPEELPAADAAPDVDTDMNVDTTSEAPPPTKEDEE